MGVTIEADYVVIGAGAMGMAFTDEILSRSEATVAMIDIRARPGGHWNDAYPFVRLHQPSSFYGVGSTQLGTEDLDRSGWNVGLAELASGSEVCAYFDQVMNRRFLSSGRVSFYPSMVFSDGRAVSSPSGKAFEVRAHRAVVDGTYMKVSVPATQPPRYAVDSGVRVVPPNQLPRVPRPEGGYVVVGAGKTAFDAILWMLANFVEPEEITWIVPRDSWLLNRAFIQPGDGFRVGEQLAIVAAADSPGEAFEGLERAGHFLRIDPLREPTMYRCATVSEKELEQLRRIENVVRSGRVRRIREDAVELDGETLARSAGTLYVDCSADGLESRPAVPVFGEGTITLQALRGCQQVFSAALTGMIESLSDASPTEKNELASVIPHPDTTRDYFSGTLAHLQNMVRWSQNAEVSEWIDASRLSPGGFGEGPDPGVVLTAAAKIEKFLSEWRP